MLLTFLLMATNEVINGENLAALKTMPDESFQLIYIDPPFNTGRSQVRTNRSSISSATGNLGFQGKRYEQVVKSVLSYDDDFADYWAFLEPRLIEAYRLLHETGTIYLHLDYREAHYAKVLMDALFGRECFLNEIIWAYDYGGKSKSRWPAKHDTILVYVKNPAKYFLIAPPVHLEPSSPPVLVTPEKLSRAKLRTAVGCHTIVPRPQN